MTVFVRAPYNYDADAVSNETGLKCDDATMTQQHQKEEADINTIVKRFGLTGELPSYTKAPQYGDFTDVTDYHSAVNQVMMAERSFMSLPADVRQRFANDPEQFVAFCSDPANLSEMVKLGLATKRPDGSIDPNKADKPPVEPAK